MLFVNKYKFVVSSSARHDNDLTSRPPYWIVYKNKHSYVLNISPIISSIALGSPADVLVSEIVFEVNGDPVDYWLELTQTIRNLRVF